MQKTGLKFNNNVLTKKGKKTLGYLFDYSITIVFLIAFYVLINFIGSSFAGVKTVRTNVSNSQQNLYAFVEKTGLGEINKNGKLKDDSTIADEFVKKTVYYTLKEIEGKSDVEISYSSYKDIEPITPDTDHLYTYYVTYKPKNLDLYSTLKEEKKSQIGLDYYLDEILCNNLNQYFEETDYPHIKQDIADKIDNYFRDDNYSVGENAYNIIYNSYYKAMVKAIDEVVKYNDSYIKINKVFEESRIKLFNIQVLEISISYLLAFGCSYILPIVIFKYGRTFGFRVLKLVFTRIDGNKPRALNVIIRGIIQFISQYFVIDLFCLLLFGVSGIYIIMHQFTYGISIFYMSIFSGLLTICSFILMFINKQYSQTISEFLGKLICKDTNEFIVVEEKNGKNGTNGK